VPPQAVRAHSRTTVEGTARRRRDVRMEDPR
jgi:hypothetical protein